MPRASISYRQTVLADNPLAYWRCNEPASPIVDFIGGLGAGGNSGALQSQPGALTGDADPGVASGASGWFDAGNAGSLAFPGTLPHTIECWFKPSVVDGSIRAFLSFRAGGGNGWAVWHKNTSPFIGFEGFNAGLVRGAYNSEAPLVAGQWYHYVFAFDGTNGSQYLNGRRVGANGGAAAIAAGNDLRFLSDAGGLAAALGSIDEVAFYNYALSAQRIMAHYLSGAQSLGLRPAADYRSLILSDGPAGYWRLDDAVAVAADQTGRNSAPISGGFTLGVGGAIGDGSASVLFDGINGGISFGNILSPGPAWSLECWLWLAGTRGAASALMGKELVFKYGIDANALTMRMGVGNGGAWTNIPVAIDAGLRTRVWSHLVAASDGATMKLYANGQQVGSSAASAPGTNGQPFIISGAGGEFVNGAMDEAALYPYALSAQQAMQHYQTGLRAA